QQYPLEVVVDHHDGRGQMRLGMVAPHRVRRGPHQLQKPRPYGGLLAVGRGPPVEQGERVRTQTHATIVTPSGSASRRDAMPSAASAHRMRWTSMPSAMRSVAVVHRIRFPGTVCATVVGASGTPTRIRSMSPAAAAAPV